MAQKIISLSENKDPIISTASKIINHAIFQWTGLKQVGTCQYSQSFHWE